ncbi:uncharacterized protein LOC143893471 isoform X2 [Temnothorax americanus]
MKKSSPTDSAVDGAVTPNASDEPLAPIDITVKLNLLENPVKPPIVIYKHTNRWDKLKVGLEPADQQIVDRLRKLKDEERNVPLPTVEEIKQRLALLKDQSPEAGGSNVIDIHRVDTRTDQEKADDLIQEYLAQIELPSTSDLCKDFERLDFLRDDGGKTRFDQGLEEKINTYKIFDRTNDNDVELINKVSTMEEASSIETSPNVEDEDEDEDEEENECVMCFRNANKLDLYRCTGCTGDLYCPACFESAHDESEMIDEHKAVRFIKKNKRDKLSSAKMSLIQKLLTSDSQKNNH